MHFLLNFLVFGFTSYALGNFWMFGTDYEAFNGDRVDAYQFFSLSYPSCDLDVSQSSLWEYKDDVSDQKLGVRVYGSDEDPDIVEVHVTKVHFTIYKDRGYRAYDTHNNQIGICQRINHIQYTCSYLTGYSMFHCNSKYTVADFQK